MKVTYNWLKDYVDIKDSPEELAHHLTMAGSEVTSVERKAGDFVFELEITPNRPDCLSVIGMAREIAAITGKKLSLPTKYYILHAKKLKDSLPINIEIQAKKLCPRYSGRVIEGVKVSASPKWMQERLITLGLRPVNSIVDVTNYCLFETGQPMHAFDYDKIKGSKIVVRCAKKGEEITTIDGIKRELSSDMLIIADEKRPIAIAGVMGGLDTEVGPSTKNILLESAYFDPVSVRLTSRELGLASESSYRFERSVDLESVVDASNRAAILINKLAGGKAGVLVDKGDKKVKPKEICYNAEKTNKVLGCNIPSKIQVSIFKALGLKATGSKNKLKVKIPFFRRDLNCEVDLVEEAARIYGYDKIPTTIPTMISQSMRKDLSRVVQEDIRKALVASGLTEILTYSLISKADLKKFSDKKTNIIDIINPLSVEQQILRPTILVGMLNAVLWNINRRIENLRIFELANTYFKDKGGFKEELNLGIVITGELGGNWRQKREVDFFDIKGIIESLFYKLGIEGIGFSKDVIPYFSKEQSASIEIGGTKIGIAGKIKNDILEKFDIKQNVYAAELCVERLLSCIKLKKHFKPIPKFPSVKRDVSIILDRNIPASQIISKIREIGIPSIRKIEIFDEYHGKQIPPDKKSLSFSILYQDKSKTLTDSEVEAAHSKVKQTLTQKFSAQFR